MNRDQLLAAATDADRQADAIFRSIDAERNRLPTDMFGGVPLIPAGRERDAQRASDLCRRARTLCADADDFLAAVPTPSSKTGASPAPVTPPSPLNPRPAAGSSTARKRSPAVDPIEAIAARIMNA